MPSHPNIHTYYDHTRFDYRFVWNSGRTRAVHFGYYDDHAQRHHHALDNLNRALANLAAIRPGEQVLDAGCGLGGSCFWLAEHRQAQVTGISIVKGQIADCRRFLAKNNFSLVDFEVADYCHTPFPDASFDVVWACESLCHATQKADFYREAYRVLRPGGRLVLAEYLRKSRPHTPRGEQLLEEWLRPWAIPDLDTAEEHRAHAQAAGFTHLVITDATAQVRVSLRNLRDLSLRWLPYGKVLHFIGLVSTVRLNNVHASIRQYEALEEGAWKYGVLLAVK